MNFKRIGKFITTCLMGTGLVSGLAQAQSLSTHYSWLSEYSDQNSLENRITPPPGFSRMPCEAGSFCDWLRDIPLKPEGSPVRYHSGDIKHHASHHAVLDLDTGRRDLQQCADAVMRLKAEYHYARGEYSKIHFNFTSGHKVSFDDWRQGRKPVVSGNKVRFTEKKGPVDNSYANFKKYMIQIFSYAGTYSLAKELDTVKVRDIQVGDVFIVGGMPGHAVMVMDVVENQAGNKMFLLAQSYMPAQDMHILKNPDGGIAGPWYRANFHIFLNTPEWQFTSGDLKRFKG